MALIEAMASELPVVATDVSGTKQVMVDGKTGILVQPGESSQLVSAIDRVLSNPSSAKGMGEASRKRVEKLFSAHTQAKEYIELYQNGPTVNGTKISLKGNQA